MGVTGFLIPACLVAVFEGGLFLLPAVISLLLIDATRVQAAGRPAQPSRP
jgi:hypothetical protein